MISGRKKNAIGKLLLRFRVRGPLRRELESQRAELERLRVRLVALQHDVQSEAEKRDKIAMALLEQIERRGGGESPAR